VLVGAPGRKVRGHAFQGAVEVYGLPRSPRRGPPRHLAQLTAPDGEANDALGISVAISGSVVVAGANLHRVGATPEQGVAYVFQPSATGWSDARETAELLAEAGQPDERFGGAVAISGDTIVVGAPYRSVKDFQQGAALVFVKPAAGWSGSHTPTAQLTASDPGKEDRLGGALAISASLIVAGAPGHLAEHGAGYAFVKPAAGWRTATESGETLAPVSGEGNLLGEAVALADGTIFLGAPNREVHGVRAAGAVDLVATGP
jgi:hypothetical protein